MKSTCPEELSSEPDNARIFPGIVLKISILMTQAALELLYFMERILLDNISVMSKMVKKVITALDSTKVSFRLEIC